MVVVGIIIVLVSITMPAIGPMLASNKEAQVMNTLGGLLINAQATSIQSATCAGLRIERAFRTNDAGFMVDANGLCRIQPGYDTTNPVVPLDHQRARFVTLSAYKEQVFTHLAESKVYDLPKDYWLAPDYALYNGFPEANKPNSLDETLLGWAPQYSSIYFAPYNRIETFYIIFNAQGELVYYPAGKLVYADQTQQFMAGSDVVLPKLPHSDPSARSVYVYDRRMWDEILKTDSVARQSFLRASRAVNINRITGTIVEEKTQ